MRDLLLIALIFGGLLLTMRYPFVGLLLWAWFTLATPHQAAYQAAQLPLNLLIAGGTIVSCIFNQEFRNFKFNPLVFLLALFAFWLWLSQQFSLDPENSAQYFDRFFKILIFIFLTMVLVKDRLRFHALLWVFAIVMGFYGTKGGLFTILTFGQNIYFGLPDNILYDNNHMGIALVTSLPIFLYLAGQVENRIAKLGLYAVFLLTIAAVIGTHSRGAFVSLIIFGFGAILLSKHKIPILIGLFFLSIPTAFFIPAKWYERMSTIQSASDDESFQGRVDAWVINLKLAQEHPLTGAGLRNPYQNKIAQTVSEREPRAAHSIYFEILGGTGFAGLFIYLGLLGGAFLTAFLGVFKYKKASENTWRNSFAAYAQISLAAFGIGAASVSMEMWEGYLLLIAMISVLAHIEGSNEQEAGKTKNSKLPWKKA